MPRSLHRRARRSGLIAAALACAVLAAPAAGQAASNVEAQPASIGFGAVVVGQTGPDQTVTFTDQGTEAAPIEGIFFSDEGIREYGIDSEDCSGELQPGGSCEIELHFAPQRRGSHPAALVLALQDGSEIFVSLSGTGLTKQIELPASFDFDKVTLGGTSETLIPLEDNSDVPVSIVKFEVSGAGAADFEITGDDCNGLVMPGTPCAVGVRYRPGAVGAESAELTVVTDASPPEEHTALGGEGVAADLTFEPAALDFGLHEVHGEGAEETLTLTDEGAASVQIEALGIFGAGAGEYSVGNTDCDGATLLPAESCSLVVHFNPEDEGILDASVRVQVAGGAAFEATLTGRGGRPLVTATPAPVDFGEAGVGTVGRSRTVTLTNTGELPVAFFLAFISGGDVQSFHLAEENCTGRVIAPGESCTAEVRFSPAAAGLRRGTISFFGAGEGALQVPLTGSGLAAGASLTPSSLDLGPQPLGAAGTGRNVTVTDGGAADLEIGTVALTGPDADQFRIASDPCTETTLAAGASCAVGVRFAPDSVGAKSATLRVRTSAGVLTAALGGEGVAPAAPVAPPASTTPRCVVPWLSGRALGAAKQALKAAGCKAGRVTRRKGAHSKTGKVVGQGRKPGTVLRAGTAVEITLARS